ncbi:tyrosine--tRNA ligase [Lachnoclostridium phytofermentans]|uniref:Tyrosine--tRNA ligase n=1 Tax=Lachnoclostridium phytofermentans (strain ATCC 700394 / DSM 18823 / ISDg) TaxID=357809 RepID=SYY_LACP7|nr:tyrosine--tRNA ligase [Lachnoclostridium phytofermentans]A9KMS8.1 RecName: Full=Tyrosine--tRNA ligase; AltName: Full=Tyrosyl-tRNA synthetase; Short=TyrRS [Lachnoclostridium phytofermentans ISDg]ABX42939.1 tyrosyl-tRNA synthetase [Lachnoclostridium phytofermentans ISDg]
MSENIYDVLLERGFIEQATHEAETKELLGKEKVTFYIGFDATADSLTAGHFLTVMAMMHMQRAGHRPIALLGGGTTMIGDPTGKSDMRSMMTRETIDHNAQCFQEQLSKFIDFSDDKAIIANNADWLLNLNYVEFLREIGVHFSVNKMLTAECYKQRMEKGLTFFEFNYMLMQSYDFWVLYKKYGCKLQLGGNDQWSNILGGVDLIRRKEQAPAFGLTFKLLTTSEGLKMGKTMKGAVWLNPEKTSPYEFYQYWRNIEDVKVEECLGLLTFLPMDEVRRLGALEGAEINHAKEVLAYEITKIVHGEEEAKKAQEAAKSLFAGGVTSEHMPTTTYSSAAFEEGIDLITMMIDAKLATSRSDARRNIEQGGVSVNDVKVTDFARKFKSNDFNDDGALLVKKGKKAYHLFRAE